MEIIDLDAQVSAVPSQQKVRAGGKTLIVKEATGEAARQYRQASVLANQWAIDDDRSIRKLASPGEIIDLEPLLIALCTYDEAGNRVTKTWVMSLHPAIQSKLFAIVRSLNTWLDGDEEADLKELKERRARIDRLIAKMEAERAHPNGQTQTV